MCVQGNGEKKKKKAEDKLEHRPTSRRRDRAEVLGLRTIKQRILYNDYATIIFNVPLDENGTRNGSRDTDMEKYRFVCEANRLEFSHVHVAPIRRTHSRDPSRVSRDIVIVSHVFY